MGGSFDPAHSGHVHVIETARRAVGLDRVWVLVSPGNPLKKTQTALVDRLGAARRRLGGRRTIVTDIEVAYLDVFRPGEGYLVYAGTGSIAAFIDEHDQFHRVGGRGARTRRRGPRPWST